MNVKIHSIGEVLLPAIAYGDAAGLPVETRSASYIAGNYGTIQHLLPVSEGDTYDFRQGMWSDDTQLSMAVARAFIKANNFSMSAIALEHAIEYNDTPLITRPNGKVAKQGWGGSTIRAMERYIAGTPTAECGEKDGAGNGVIMKLAPLAYWLIAKHTKPSTAYAVLDEFTSFTHDANVARVASRLHYDTLEHLFINGYDKSYFGTFLYTSALWHEAALGKQSSDVSRSIEYLKKEPIIDTAMIARSTDNKGFYVPQTLAMAYGAFVANASEFTSSVYEAVNLGGDTDSTASVAATLSLFSNGEIRNLPDDFGEIDQLARLQSLSCQFATSALSE